MRYAILLGIFRLFAVCDQLFFTELMREATDIAGCFSTRVRHLLHLHVASGIERYLVRFCQCFKNEQPTMIQEGRLLIEYVTMNAIAIRKILKKYDKVSFSLNHLKTCLFEFVSFNIRT